MPGGDTLGIYNGQRKYGRPHDEKDSRTLETPPLGRSSARPARVPKAGPGLTRVAQTDLSAEQEEVSHWFPLSKRRLNTAPLFLLKVASDVSHGESQKPAFQVPQGPGWNQQGHHPGNALSFLRGLAPPASLSVPQRYSKGGRQEGWTRG